MNYEVEVVRILMDNDGIRKNYPRILAVAKAVAGDDDEKVMEYVWAYASGKSDWQKLEKDLP